MMFVYKAWSSFCAELQRRGVHSISAREIADGGNTVPYIVLKHDVETNVAKALELAKIEHCCGHRGSYYVQAYLLEDAKNVAMLKEIQALGHEVSYHYDVMDSCKGDISRAMYEFEKNLRRFEECGFDVRTLCQHGNPVVERVGYHSNRDFFRSLKVQEKYPMLSDIMVDFKEKAKTEYLYFSDAGRAFNLIHDPINNDVVKSDDKNIKCADLNEVMRCIGENDAIISIHPHRWSRNAVICVVKNALFRAIKTTAKIMLQIPPVRKIMGRYYHLAKKI